MEKVIIAPEILEEIRNSTTEHLQNEFICMQENIFEEPYCAADPEYVAIAKAVEAELQARRA